MKITITSHGTRGDVQPYLALAVGLQRAGHQATLVTSDNYTDWIESYSVQTHPTQFNLQEWMRRPETQAVLEGRNFLKKMQVFFGEMRRLGPVAMGIVWEAVQDSDFVIQSPASSGALEAAQKLDTPGALAYPGPFAPTHEYPSFFIGSRRFSLGPRYNRLTHSLTHMMLWGGMSGPMTNTLRKDLGLPTLRSFAQQAELARQIGIPSLYGFSEHVVPRPTDWDNLQHITGYWFLDELPGWLPDPALVQFLESGPPPVYVGYGSMNSGDSENKTRLVLKALEMSGQRGVILTGWGGLTRLETPPNILFVDNIPHSWLFPQMAAVVHHGGAGTTGEGLRAGVPAIITPLASDQYAWAERVVELGVGPKVPDFNHLTAATLAEAINEAVNNTALRDRAAALGENIRSEDGIARAVELIETVAADFKQKRLAAKS